MLQLLLLVAVCDKGRDVHHGRVFEHVLADRHLKIVVLFKCTLHLFLHLSLPIHPLLVEPLLPLLLFHSLFLLLCAFSFLLLAISFLPVLGFLLQLQLAKTLNFLSLLLLLLLPALHFLSAFLHILFLFLDFFSATIRILVPHGALLDGVHTLDGLANDVLQFIDLVLVTKTSLTDLRKNKRALLYLRTILDLFLDITNPKT